MTRIFAGLAVFAAAVIVTIQLAMPRPQELPEANISESATDAPQAPEPVRTEASQLEQGAAEQPGGRVEVDGPLVTPTSSLTVRGFVLDADGGGIAGARIWISGGAAGKGAGRGAGKGLAKGATKGAKGAGKAPPKGAGQGGEKAGGKGGGKSRSDYPAQLAHYYEPRPAPPPPTQGPTDVVSAADGSFEVRLTGEAAEHRWITARAVAEYHVGSARSVAVESDEVQVDLQLAAAVSISGAVQTDTGAPIPDARVWLWRDQHHGVVTDADGAFTITDAHRSSGSEYISAAADGYVAAGQAILANKLDTGDPYAHVTIVLQRGARVSGLVVAYGAPLPGAEVKVGSAKNKQGPTVKTDELGEFELAGLPSGPSTLHVSHRNFLASETSIEVPPPGEERQFTVELHGGRKLSGVVRDARGEPVQAAVIAVRAEPEEAVARFVKNEAPVRRTKTNERGEFELAGLATTPLHLDCQADSFVDITGLVVPLFRDHIELTLAQGTTLRGRVSTEDGAVLAGARIGISPVIGEESSLGAPPPTKCDQDGTYELAEAGAGRWNLVVEHPDCMVFVQPIEIPPGVESWNQDVQVLPQAELRGVVLDVRGQPVPHARVVLQAIEAPTLSDYFRRYAHRWLNRSGDADQAGRFAFQNLAPGRYILRHLESSPGPLGKSLWHHSMPVTISGREPHDVQLTAPGSATIRGTLSATTAIPPLVFVQLVAEQDEDTSPEDRIDPLWTRAVDGAFSFEGVGAGDYELRVHIEDRQTGATMEATQRIQVSDGSEQTTVVVLRQ